MVRPLTECISRPDEEPGGLIAHLEAVARVCGNSKGSLEEKLAFLAGLAHDAAKASEGWQRYIRRPEGQRGKGPPHAPLGAGLFAFWTNRLIELWCDGMEEEEKAHDLVLDWVRMIYRHHGALDNLETDPPWGRVTGPDDNRVLLKSCDCVGLDGFVRTHFPEYDGSLLDYDDWEDEYADSWGYRVQTARANAVRGMQADARDRLGLRLARLGGKLIYADRLHAAAWKPEVFPADLARSAILEHEKHCANAAADARKKGACESLIQARTGLQHAALARYHAHRDSQVFTLLLPTGYGKTLTGLRVALEAICSGRCKRLIYVAPYIIILSQAAKVIEEATGRPVFMHHHLSILECKDRPADDEQAEDHQPYDLTDSWQAPILATTFNQLFRAFFPSRAQECVRQAALDEAFIFIDEPQIVDVKVWCAFLRAVRLMCQERNAQVLFSTATLPPMEDGMGPGVPVISLAVNVEPVVHRYTLHHQDQPWKVAQVVEQAKQKKKDRHSVACILNTVRDAVEVFVKVGGHKEGWRFLAAMMLPGHKSATIDAIRVDLEAKREVGVICTQVLEAGVDLSFRSLLRARPIFSSVAQAAGRANRHAEGDRAEVIVFPFHREDNKDSREYVYRDESARNHTDRILRKDPLLEEPKVPGALAEYYRECWNENPHTGSLVWYDRAARGQWTSTKEKQSLGGLDPFGQAYPVEEVFIPGSETYLADRYRKRLLEFGVGTASGLLDLYLDRDHRRTLDYRRRKLMSALLRQFLVSVPCQRAGDIATRVEGCDWLWRLDDSGSYSEETGLAHCLCASAPESACMIF